MIGLILFFLLQQDCRIYALIDGMSPFVEGESPRSFQLNQDYEITYYIYHQSGDDNHFYFSRIDKPENTYLDKHGFLDSQVGTVTDTIRFDEAHTQHELNVLVHIFDYQQPNKIIHTCSARLNLFIPKFIYLPMIYEN